MNEMFYFPLGIATFFLFYLSGYPIASRIRGFNEEEKLMLTFLISISIFTIAGLVYHMLGLSWNFLLLLPISLIIFLGIFINKGVVFHNGLKLLFFLLLIQYLSKLVFNIFIPLFPMGDDWMVNYYQSLNFLKPVWNLTNDLADRSPLYSFVCGIFLGIFSKEFWIMQIVSSLLNSLFLLPVFLIAKKIFNQKVALLTFIFLSITPFAVETSLYTFSKNLTAFFILMFYYLIFTKKIANPLLGISAGLAYLAHPYSLLFIGSGVLILLFKKQFQFNSFLKFIFLTLLIALPWLLWNFIDFGTIPSVFKYYPFAVNGYENLHNETFQQVWSEFISKPLWYIIFIRVVNAVISLTPIFLLTRIAATLMPVTIQTYKIVSFSNLAWTHHHLQTIFGALTTFLFIFTSIEFIRLFKNKKSRYFTWFIILPFLFSLVYVGWIQLIAHSISEPLVYLLTMIGFFGVSKTKNPDKWIKLVFIFAIIETIIFVYWFGLHIELTRQIETSKGTIGKYESLCTAYKLFFGGQDAINSHVCM
jgi:4-amino-4-deoxy-L-arabinose transferase-like glycosyltransferase